MAGPRGPRWRQRNLEHASVRNVYKVRDQKDSKGVAMITPCQTQKVKYASHGGNHVPCMICKTPTPHKTDLCEEHRKTKCRGCREIFVRRRIGQNECSQCLKLRNYRRVYE